MFKTAVAIILLGIFAVITGDYLGKQILHARTADNRKIEEDFKRRNRAVEMESQRRQKEEAAKYAKIRANFQLYLEDLRKKEERQYELEAQK